MTALFVLYVVIVLTDAWSTHKILGAGGRELNPVARWLMEKIGVDLALVVSCSIGVLFAGAFLLDAPWYLLGGLALGHGAVVVNNLRVMHRMGLL